MTLQVLISCMHQNDHSIIERSNIQSDVVVINQCDVNNREEWTFRNKKGEECNALFISTTQRGLSRSRNMAIENASADLCLFCDDDEKFVDDYKDIIVSTYLKNKSSFIAFNVIDKNRVFPRKIKKINFIRALKLASWQISFVRKLIIDNKIKLDETMGAGVTMGAGEENKFVIDCLKSGLNGIYVPSVIASVAQESTTWDLSMDNASAYFHDRGHAYYKLMGYFLGSIYIFYSSIKKWKYYTKFMPLPKCVFYQFKGLLFR